MLHTQSLRPGDHACAIYDHPDEQLTSIAAYIQSGLDRGERCLYIVDDRRGEDVLAALTTRGIDVAGATASGRLVLLTKRESYLKNGTFDPDHMIWTLSAMTDEACAEGCRGLRITGEMTWALGPEAGCDRVMDYERKLNQFFPSSRAHAICQYNASRFAPAVIREVLRNHPIAVIGDRAIDNPFYEPPHVSGLPEGHPEKVRHMLRQLVRHAVPHRFSTDDPH